MASLLNALTFSLSVNGSLDKFGWIDPSTSTVLIGMTLGGTWGFILDSIYGSDEGFREYLWSPTAGMAYAMGSIRSAKFVRYFITIIFDMFFTVSALSRSSRCPVTLRLTPHIPISIQVILFKKLYSKLVLMAGFTVSGREWIANGFISSLISFVTFQVYANMTRFQWAYPSGTEDVINQWIAGPTMVLATVIMNMVYLITETRTRVGEPGINDPNVKIGVTICTFLALYGIQAAGYDDPSILTTYNSTTADLSTNFHLPLKEVCHRQAYAAEGIACFALITLLCLAFVIFATSSQSLSGLRDSCGCGGKSKNGASGKRGSMPNRRSQAEVGQPLPAPITRGDKLRGKICLFVVFNAVTFLIVVIFAFAPFYSIYAGGFNVNGTASFLDSDGNPMARDDSEWRDACNNYRDDASKAKLAAMGLS